MHILISSLTPLKQKQQRHFAVSIFPYHNVKNQKKKVSKSPEEVACNAQMQMDEQNHFFERNLRKYNLLQFNAYNFLTSCEKPGDAYRLLLYRKFVYTQTNR